MNMNYSFKKINRLEYKWYNLVYKITNMQSRWRIGMRAPELVNIDFMSDVYGLYFSCETTIWWTSVILLINRVHHNAVLPKSGISGCLKVRWRIIVSTSCDVCDVLKQLLEIHIFTHYVSIGPSKHILPKSN